MSAYLCSPDTFDFLASAAIVFSHHRTNGIYNIYLRPEMPDVPALKSDGILEEFTTSLNPISDADKIGAVLRAQNIRSIQARYPEGWDDMLDDGYAYRRVESRHITPAAVLKSCACVRYQSCETADYSDTFAAHVLDTIEKLAVNALPGYDDAPWGWERPELVKG